MKTFKLDKWDQVKGIRQHRMRLEKQIQQSLVYQYYSPPRLDQIGDESITNGQSHLNYV